MDKTIYESKCKELESFEKELKDKYGTDFASVGWHGRLSQQRILFQHTKFLQMMSDKDMVKAVLKRHQDGTEQNLGAGNKIATALCFALSGNNLSYLATVAPNWANVPKIDGYNWGHIDGMGSSFPVTDDPAFEPDLRHLKNFQKAMKSIQSVMNEIAPEDVKISRQEKDLQKELDDASVSELIKVFNGLINDPSKIKSITVGEAGWSTFPQPMANQSYGVMKHYNKLLNEVVENSDEKALGYGMISHALDARHLAAALYYDAHDDDASFSGNSGRQAFHDLMERAQGNPNSQTALLVKVRLHQLMKIVAEKQGIDSLLTAFKLK